MKIPKKGKVIAIDGPAGTGKSSATKLLAKALGFVHVDTGALYRGVALLCERQGLDFSKLSPPYDEKTQEFATEIARAAHFQFRIEPELNPSQRLFVNGEDVSDYIRTPEISMGASRVSAIPGVRASLLGLQRYLGCEQNAILEGRDIGTVVFPDADVKFFLGASVEERAKRRLAELESRGMDIPSFEELKAQMVERDRGDSERAIAPLKKADDAVEIDTTQLTLDQVVEKMRTEFEKRR